LENSDVLKRLYEIKKDTGLQIGITTSGSHQSEIIEAALKVKIENEDLFDSYQVTYNIFEQSTYAILKHLLQLGKTVIIRSLSKRPYLKRKFSHYQKLYQIVDAMAKKYQVEHRCYCTPICHG
jgi:aryl-alcohol dehydrogenase-like predicted oxidoreductase